MNEKTDNSIPEGSPGKSSSSEEVGQTDGDAGGGTGIRKVITGFASKLGLGHAKPDNRGVTTGDVSTSLAHQRTDLAMDRNMLAAERTLMAWIRTSLSMISFGFTIGKLGQILHEVNVKGVMGRVRSLSVENIAYFLVILGTGALIGASLQHWQRMRALRAMGLRRKLSITLIVAILLSVVGGFALGTLILAL